MNDIRGFASSARSGGSDMHGKARLEPKPPPTAWVREPEHDFAAWAASAGKVTWPYAALLSCSRCVLFTLCYRFAAVKRIKPKILANVGTSERPTTRRLDCSGSQQDRRLQPVVERARRVFWTLPGAHESPTPWPTSAAPTTASSSDVPPSEGV